MWFFGNRTPYTSLSIPQPPFLLRRMLICWCGCSPSPPVQGGGTPLSPLSFCPWIKQLPLSLFSHGSRRSVLASAAAKAFQSACHLCGASQTSVAVALSTPVTRAEMSVVDLSALPVPARVCVCVSLCVLNVSISVQISSHMESRASNNGSNGEWSMCSCCDNE